MLSLAPNQKNEKWIEERRCTYIHTYTQTYTHTYKHIDKTSMIMCICKLLTKHYPFYLKVMKNNINH